MYLWRNHHASRPRATPTSTHANLSENSRTGTFLDQVGEWAEVSVERSTAGVLDRASGELDHSGIFRADSPQLARSNGPRSARNTGLERRRVSRLIVRHP